MPSINLLLPARHSELLQQGRVVQCTKSRDAVLPESEPSARADCYKGTQQASCHTQPLMCLSDVPYDAFSVRHQPACKRPALKVCAALVPCRAAAGSHQIFLIWQLGHLEAHATIDSNPALP